MADSKCSVAGCEKRPNGSLCSAHRWRLSRHGSFDQPVMSMSEEKRFFAKVVITGDDNCWLWLGQKSKDGYGKFKFSGGQLAHRYSFLFHNKNLPPYSDTSVVMHSCNNKECTNPRHLSIGTSAQNNNDARRDGLFKKRVFRRGSLSGEKATLIYMEQLPYKEIARKYDCSVHTVASIKCGREYAYSISRYLA